MYFDHNQANLDKKSKANFEELKLRISKLEDGKVNEFYYAYRYILDLEIKMKKLEEKNNEYFSFFSKLSSLMPRTFLANDIIG